MRNTIATHRRHPRGRRLATHTATSNVCDRSDTTQRLDAWSPG